jgi:hypothetical protein
MIELYFKSILDKRKNPMKHYVGIIRDHSLSMNHLTHAAMKDYNQTIQALKDGQKSTNIETIVYTLKCGTERNHPRNDFETMNSNVERIPELTSYRAVGGYTPLFTAVNEMIEKLKLVPDANKPGVAFTLSVTTDGENNAGFMTGHALGEIIRKLQGTDRWTFSFRVPRGYATKLANLGIPSSNIMEWDQTERGVELASVQTQAAFASHYKSLSRGHTSSKTFYADTSHLTKQDVSSNLVDLSGEVDIWTNNGSETQIRDFVEDKTRQPFRKGKAFYELKKRERTVQDYKVIVIRDRQSRRIYGGQQARKLLNIPTSGNISLAPGNHKGFDIFVQSTSVNRKISNGDKVLIWNNAS